MVAVLPVLRMPLVFVGNLVEINPMVIIPLMNFKIF